MPISLGAFKLIVAPALAHTAFWITLPPGRLEDWQIMQHAVGMELDPGEMWDEAVKRGHIRPEAGVHRSSDE